MRENNISIATNAKDYARNKIKQGTTQLETNALSFAEKSNLISRLTKMRDKIYFKTFYNNENCEYSPFSQKIKIPNTHNYSLSTQLKIPEYVPTTNEKYNIIFIPENNQQIIIIPDISNTQTTVSNEYFDPIIIPNYPYNNQTFQNCIDTKNTTYTSNYLPKYTDFEANRFLMSINSSQKESLGNCHELAEMALDYIIINHPEIHAETYRIEGGDHVFVVIGRSENSKADDPTTWGDAIICDPWSNSIYPANEYKTNLKNYIQNPLEAGGDYENKVEDLRSEMSLKPLAINTKNYQILSQKTNYDGKRIALNESTKELKATLNKIYVDLESKYGVGNMFFSTVSETIANINKLQAKIENRLPEKVESCADIYRLNKYADKFNKNLHTSKIKNPSSIISNNNNSLFSTNNPNTQLNESFNITNTQAEFDDSINKAINSIKSFL